MLAYNYWQLGLKLKSVIKKDIDSPPLAEAKKINILMITLCIVPPIIALGIWYGIQWGDMNNNVAQSFEDIFELIEIFVDIVSLAFIVFGFR